MLTADVIVTYTTTSVTPAESILLQLHIVQKRKV